MIAVIQLVCAIGSVMCIGASLTMLVLTLQGRL